jgi:hypothetical protein
VRVIGIFLNWKSENFRIACVFLHVERDRSSRRVWRSPRIIDYHLSKGRSMLNVLSLVQCWKPPFSRVSVLSTTPTRPGGFSDACWCHVIWTQWMMLHAWGTVCTLPKRLQSIMARIANRRNCKNGKPAQGAESIKNNTKWHNLRKTGNPFTKRLEFLLQQSMFLGTRNAVPRSISGPNADGCISMFISQSDPKDLLALMLCPANQP